MANNTTLNTGAGGDVIRNIDKAGAKTQVVTLDLGGSGTESLVAGSIPVTGAFFPATQPVSGTFFQATQPVSIAASVAVTGSFFQATQPVSGTVAISNYPAIQNVTAINNGVVSSTNSTAANLGVGAIFTGTGEDVSEYSTIVVNVFASHASATDGLMLQQSIDNTNWDLSDTFSIPAASGKTFSVGVQAKFFRIVYTNGATLTTSLRVQTLYSRTAKKFSSVRPQDARSNDNDFEEILGYSMAYNGTTWDRVRSAAKSIQAANALATQDLKDSGRVHVSIYGYQVPGIITTEALFGAGLTFSSRDGAAGVQGQQFAVTAGKRFRIQSLSVTIKNTAAAAGTSKLVLRYLGAGGTILNTSPTLLTFDLGSNNATAANYLEPISVQIPDGLELVSGSTFGFTNLSSAATMLHTITLLGYEY